MKKHLTLLLLFSFGVMSAQKIKFSTKTKEKFESIVSSNVSQGMDKKEAIKLALKDEDYLKLQHADLAKINKDANKKGIIFSKNFGQIALHKKVAIIPFTTSFENNADKKQSKKENIEKERALAELIQESVYKYLMKNQFDYPIDIQDITKTNRILKSSGVLKTLTSTEIHELAQLLEVDAIISGDFTQELNKKSTGNRALNAAINPLSLLSSSKKTKGIISLLVNDAETGDVIWRFENEEEVSSNDIDKTVSRLMKDISKYFPYSAEFSK